jgi:two-component system chemotaxis sensor kinase CheA
MERLADQFLIEGRELVQAASDDLAKLADRPDSPGLIDAVFRAVHTLKGSTALFDLRPMSDMLHAAEDLLGALRKQALTPDIEIVDVLVLCIDQAARWLDAFEADGALPADAAQVGHRMQGDLGRWSGGNRSPEAEPADDGGAIDRSWVDPLVAGLDPLPDGPLVALRYMPREDSFFVGDDPIAILKAVPALCAVSIGARQPWGALEDFDPFRCNLVIDALAAAPRADVQKALRLVSDQVDVIEVDPARLHRRPSDGEAVRDAASRSLRVGVDHIDALAHIADEIVIANNALAHLAAQARQGVTGDAWARGLLANQLDLDRLVASLHRAVTRIRLVPLSSLFQRFPRLVRETAARLDKDIGLAIEGELIEVDKSLVDGLFEPILHLLRNAADHGIEAADERQRIGKPPHGAITLGARRSADRVVIEIADDGRGIDPGRIRATALARGLLPEAALAALSDRAAVDLIFMPGFSTVTAVTDLSGRGVGMDVVRTAVSRLGGQIELDSVAGRGTTARLSLPVAVLLTNMIVVACAGEIYGVPMDMVVETVRVPRSRIVPVRNGRAFVLRETVIPVLELSTLLGAAAAVAKPDARMLVMQGAGGLVAVAVDEFVDRLNLLLRPMSGLLSGMPGIAGSAVLGDGKVLMVLDLPGLIG